MVPVVTLLAVPITAKAFLAMPDVSLNKANQSPPDKLLKVHLTLCLLSVLLWQLPLRRKLETQFSQTYRDTGRYYL